MVQASFFSVRQRTKKEKSCAQETRVAGIKHGGGQGCNSDRRETN